MREEEVRDQRSEIGQAKKLPRMAFGLTEDRSRASRGTPVNTDELPTKRQAHHAMNEEEVRDQRSDVRGQKSEVLAEDVPPKIAESHAPRMAFGLTEDRSRASRGAPIGDDSREFAVKTPSVDTRKNPSGPLLVRSEQREEAARKRLQEQTGFRVTSTGERAVDESGNALRYDPKAQTPVTEQEFEALLMRVLPEEIRALCFNRLNFDNSPTASPTPGMVAVIGDNGIPGWGAGGGAFSGRVFVGGHQFNVTVPTTGNNRYLKVYFDGTTAPEFTTGMIMDDTYEVYDLNYTSGDIHESRT